MSKLDEFEVLFAEQRKAVEIANVPLYERLPPDTKKLFTAPIKEERVRTRGDSCERRQIPEQTLTFSQYQKQVKDPKKVENIVTILGQRLPSLRQEDLEELLWILPEADKNLFL